MFGKVFCAENSNNVAVFLLHIDKFETLYQLTTVIDHDELLIFRLYQPFHSNISAELERVFCETN